MTQKSPTTWQANPDKATGVTYSSSTTQYSSSSTSYSSADSAEDEFAKTPEAWTKVAKTAEAWSFNPAARTSLYVYDSASHAYDSAVDTYDGIVSGEGFAEQKTPTAWAVL